MNRGLMFCVLILQHATDCNNQEMRETNNLSAITVKNTRATSLVMNTCGNGRSNSTST